MEDKYLEIILKALAEKIDSLALELRLCGYENEKLKEENEKLKNAAKLLEKAIAQEDE